MTKIEAAINVVLRIDDIALDDNPQTSVTEIGIWVQTWVFVRNEDIAEEMDSND